MQWISQSAHRKYQKQPIRGFLLLNSTYQITRFVYVKRNLKMSHLSKHKKEKPRVYPLSSLPFLFLFFVFIIIHHVLKLHEMSQSNYGKFLSPAWRTWRHQWAWRNLKGSVWLVLNQMGLITLQWSFNFEEILRILEKRSHPGVLLFEFVRIF